MPNPTCSVPDCDKPSRTAKADYCPMHYHRWYRHGSVDKTASGSGITASLGRRYRTIYNPTHPLAGKNGKVYEHRAVLYDQIGPGPHPCHWCEDEVDWLPKGTPGALQVDHLNNDGADNAPANLAPSCAGCNTARGQQRKAAALASQGWWSSHDTIARLKSGGRRAPIERAA